MFYSRFTYYSKFVITFMDFFLNVQQLAVKSAEARKNMVVVFFPLYENPECRHRASVVELHVAVNSDP